MGCTQSADIQSRATKRTRPSRNKRRRSLTVVPQSPQSPKALQSFETEDLGSSNVERKPNLSVYNEGETRSENALTDSMDGAPNTTTNTTTLTIDTQNTSVRGDEMISSPKWNEGGTGVTNSVPPELVPSLPISPALPRDTSQQRTSSPMGRNHSPPPPTPGSPTSPLCQHDGNPLQPKARVSFSQERDPPLPRTTSILGLGAARANMSASGTMLGSARNSITTVASDQSCITLSHSPLPSNNQSYPGIAAEEPERPEWWQDYVDPRQAQGFQYDTRELRHHFQQPSTRLVEFVQTWTTESTTPEQQ